MRVYVIFILLFLCVDSNACPAPQMGEKYDKQIALKKESKSVYVASVPYDGNNYKKDINMTITHFCKEESNVSAPKRSIPVDTKYFQGLVFGRFITLPRDKCEAYVEVQWFNVSCGAYGVRKVE